MSANDKINREVEQTLQSLDGMARASANPFLYTRIRAKMQQVENSRWEKLFSFISRPVVAIALLLLIMAINGWVVFSSGSAKENIATEYTGAGVSELANEYILVASSTSYAYENLSNE